MCVCVCVGGGEGRGIRGGGRDPECLSLKSSGRHRMSETQPAGHYPKGYCGGCSLDIVVVCVSSAVFNFWLLGNIYS